MKVYTYANPFSINKAEYWDEIRNLPQLCISQTLVEGMKACYGRKSFTVLTTIQSFLNEFYKEWENSPENDITQYTELSDYISNITNENIKRSMKFNKKEVLEALKYCIELGLEPERFKKLNDEQLEFINIYKDIKNSDVWNKLDLRTTPERYEELNKCLINLIIKDINKELGYNNIETSKEKRRSELQYKIQELKSKNKKKNKSPLRRQREEIIINDKIDLYEHFIKLNENENLIFTKSIVIHGVHQFTPAIWNIVNHLEKLNVEVIFLINYDKNFKRIYNTWERIYHHLTGKFNFDKYSTEDGFAHKDLGRKMGDLLEGKRIIRSDPGTKFNVFDNLTSFSDYVSDIYKTAQEEKKLKGGGRSTLSYMSKQFYAVSSQSVNDVLKTQYPEQYGEKHFLSYPIGAFILGLYNMWNADSNRLEIDETNLRECLSIGFWKTDLNITPISIYDRINLYFKNVNTLEEYIERIKDLKKNKYSLSKNKVMDEYFSKMTIYSVTMEELAYFESVLLDLKDISNRVFNIDSNNKVNYAKHFKKLMDIILQKSEENSEYIDEAELQLVKEIADKLNSSANLKVNGAVEDLKEAIHFYLSRRKDDLDVSADWIVRDFEQIDGGVLLSKDARDKTYHYAMLSDKNMKGKEKQIFKWPLSNEMIEGYDEYHSGIDLIVTAKKEYKNFLRYSLFYGMYFLNGNIELSFIENCEGEKEIPYFILTMIGFKPERIITDEVDDSEKAIRKFPDDLIDHSLSVSELDRQMYSICPGKYLYNSIMNNKFYYRNEFQCRYYYIILLRILTWQKSVGKGFKEACSILESINNDLEKFLPFWNEVDFIDIKHKVKQDMEMDLVDNKVKDYDSNEDYIKKKLNFLVARYDDNEGQNLMKFRRNTVEDVRLFLAKNNLNVFNNMANEKICQYCNQREVCLYEFIEGDEDA